MFDIRVIVGLGNPGAKYIMTRHNVGFQLLDYLAEGFLERSTGWKSSFDAQVCDGYVAASDEKLMLCKPQTYMNCSGEPLLKLLQFYKVKPKQCLVVHDEVDLAFGVTRLKLGGGEAGHNGLRSISSCLGTKDYYRLRIGVGKPEGEEARIPLADWLLRSFAEQEKKQLEDIYKNGVDFLFACFNSGVEHARNRFHS